MNYGGKADTGGWGFPAKQPGAASTPTYNPRTTMNSYIDKELINRLTRIETKLVRGFEELGVNIDKDAEWLSVDEPNRVVYISTLGRSMTVMLSDMQRGGATKEGDWYDIVHRGVVVGTILFKKLS